MYCANYRTYLSHLFCVGLVSPVQEFQEQKQKLPGLAKVAVVDRRARMAGLADIARLTGVGKFARLIRVATREYCLVWFELPCWSERPGSWWWGVSGHE